ncbi:oxidoreductase [Prolixibacter bellariivorans]|uniref:Oxidoreductase n=1 Tax=Prolixibacter bellariivorans TaxID=314319 RepID=A0A5M4AUV7_9BACT|nr:SDR family oxidoreductase [Prolixibacter bellariivorans]GET31564.1 oxidoreductase [Prolixibacter bellariivorans]
MKKVALITGASTGIGKELATIHAEKGGDVILVARSKDKLVQLKHDLELKHQASVLVMAKDLTQPGAPEEVYDEVKKAGWQVDYLINNAGFGGRGKFHEREWEKDLAMINLNIVALTTLTRLFLPDFVKRNEGRILNVSSTASFMPGPLQAVYFATKAYVTFFSNAIAEELSDTRITVTALMPGATETEFGRVAGLDKTEMFKNATSARKVAEDGYNGMMKGKLDVVSGLPFAMKMMLPMIPFLPKKMVLKQIRQMQEVK